MEGTEFIASGRGIFRGAGSYYGGVIGDKQISDELRIESLDAVEVELREVDGRNLSAPD